MGLQIGPVLKKNREKLNLSVEQVSIFLSNHNLKGAPKTIYGWERGHSEPDAETLMALCDLYHIENVLETFGYKDEKPQSKIFDINAHEENLIKAYREQPDMQKSVDRLLQIENHE